MILLKAFLLLLVIAQTIHCESTHSPDTSSYEVFGQRSLNHFTQFERKSSLNVVALNNFEDLNHVVELNDLQDTFELTNVLTQQCKDEINSISGKYAYIRLQGKIGEETYHFIGTNKTQYVFISAFTEFYTLKLITRKFYFSTLDFAVPIPQPSSKEIAIAQNTEIIKDIIRTTNITTNDFKLCQEITWNWFSVNFFDFGPTGPRQIVIAKSYYCCDKDLNCAYDMEKVALSILHMIFIIFKFVFAGIAISYIAKTRKFIYMRRDHAIYVTNSYYDPPFWLTYFLPMRKWAYDLRVWGSIYTIFILLLIFFINIVHSLAPIDWGDQLRNIPIISPGEFFNNVKIGTGEWPGPWCFIFIIFPISCVIITCTTIIKVCTRRVTWREKKREYSSKIPHNNLGFISFLNSILFGSLRLLYCAFLAAITAPIVIFFLLRAYDLYEYNEVFVFLQGGMLFIYATWHLYKSKTIVLNRWTDRLFGYRLNAYSANSLNESLLTENNKSTRNNLTYNVLFLRLRYFVVYEILSLNIEWIWFSFIFFSSFLASSVIFRAVWSTLILFILSPDDIQTGVFLATIGLTVLKLYNDLSIPYTKVRVKLLESKPLLSPGFVENWNPYILSLTQMQLKYRANTNEGLKYFIFLTWENFFEICHEAKVNFFIKKVVSRSVVTIAIIFLFYMAYLVFGEGQSNFSSDIIKLGVLSFVPLIPKVVEVIEGKNLFDDATFDTRFMSACSNVEFGPDCPPELFGMAKEDRGKLGLNPLLAIYKYNTPPPPKKSSPSKDSSDEELMDTSLSQKDIELMKSELRDKQLLP